MSRSRSFVSLLVVAFLALGTSAAAARAVPCSDPCQRSAVAVLRACRAGTADDSACAAHAAATFHVCADGRCPATPQQDERSASASCTAACEAAATDAYVAAVALGRDHGAHIRLTFDRCVRRCATDAARVAPEAMMRAVGAAATNGGATTKQAPKLPRCLQPMTTRPLLADYAAYIAAHANVQQAMNPCKMSTSILNWFFAKLEEAEQTGQAPSAPLPDGFSATSLTSYVAGGTQSDEILGAKLAHVLWIEVRNKVPWRLASWGSADLKRIFTLCKWPHPCRHDAIVDFGAQYVLDHSPRVAWSVVQQNLDVAATSDPRQALSRLLDHTRGFVHGAVYYDASGNVVRDDTWGIRTLDEMLSERISRHGCWSMVPYAMQLAAALNLPVDGVTDYYAGLGHATALFPGTDQVLPHGDDAYNALLLDTPTALVLDSYARWQADVLSYPPGSTVAAYNADVNDKLQARLHPSAYLMQQYCAAGADGRAFLDATFTTYATAQQLDALEAAIAVVTNTCATIPPDTR